MKKGALAFPPVSPGSHRLAPETTTTGPRAFRVWTSGAQGRGGSSPRRTAAARPLVVVFLPAYNEAEAIGSVIRRIPRPVWPGWRTLVMVLDDGSTDGTGEVARAAGADLVVRHPRNRGLGYTVRQAMRLAYRLGAQAAVMIDADGEYPPEAIPHVLAPILAGQADYVLGSRFRGHIRGMRWYRRLGNYTFTLLQAAILGRWISDGQTGLRAFSRPVLRSCRIVHDYNYAQVMNLNLLRQGFRLQEVPISYQVRQTGQSFIRFRDYLRRVLPAMWRELTLPVDGRTGAWPPRQRPVNRGFENPGRDWMDINGPEKPAHREGCWMGGFKAGSHPVRSPGLAKASGARPQPMAGRGSRERVLGVRGGGRQGRRSRLLVILTVLAVATLALAGCGQGEDRPGNVSVDPESGTVSVSGTGTGTHSGSASGTHSGSSSGTHSGSSTGTASGTHTGAEAGHVEPKPAGAVQVDVTLKEWAIQVQPTQVKAGPVYFLVTNEGPKHPHELVIVRSHQEPGQLPVVEGRVPEDQVNVIGEVEAFAAGTKASGLFNLDPGRYLLICNIVEQEDGQPISHFEEGMVAELTVTP